MASASSRADLVRRTVESKVNRVLDSYATGEIRQVLASSGAQFYVSANRGCSLVPRVRVGAAPPLPSPTWAKLAPIVTVVPPVQNSLWLELLGLTRYPGHFGWNQVAELSGGSTREAGSGPALLSRTTIASTPASSVRPAQIQ